MSWQVMPRTWCVALSSSLAALVATATVALGASRTARCEVVALLPGTAFCAPGNPGRFDPLLECRAVARAVGVDDHTFVASVEASGRWLAGTLDTRLAESRVRYVFGDGSGARYIVTVADGEAELTVQPGRPGKLRLDDYPTCGAQYLWDVLRKAEQRVPEQGTLVFQRGELLWELPDENGVTWLARSRGWCGVPDIAREMEVIGYYVDTLYRAPGYEPARLETCSRGTFLAPYGTDVDPVLYGAIERQVPAELRPFDPRRGAREVAPTCFSQLGCHPRRNEEAAREVKVFVRARIRVHRRYGKLRREERDHVEFLRVLEVRTVTGDDCDTWTRGALKAKSAAPYP
jgi:hypothetical protein